MDFEIGSVQTDFRLSSFQALFQCQMTLLNKVLGFNRRSRQNYLLPRASLLQSRQNLQPPLMLRFRRIIHGSASAKRMLWVRQKEGLPRNGVPAPGLKSSRIRVHLYPLRRMDPLPLLHARISRRLITPEPLFVIKRDRHHYALSVF